MTTATASLCPASTYQLCFQPLSPQAQARAFPCDAAGHVDIDSLSDTQRHAYLYARTMIGRELARPSVQIVAWH
jgi:hypothetical protein